MTEKQLLVHIQEPSYHDLCNAIQDEIDNNDDLFQVQQINYFNMEDELSSCDAFILFKPK